VNLLFILKNAQTFLLKMDSIHALRKYLYSTANINVY